MVSRRVQRVAAWNIATARAWSPRAAATSPSTRSAGALRDCARRDAMASRSAASTALAPPWPSSRS